MKIKILFLSYYLFVPVFPIFSQNCDKLLEDGLYQKINIVTRTTLSQDLRTYFLSETFKADIKSGNWGASLTIPIDGVPVSIGSNSSDEEFSQFKRKIERATSFTLNKDDFISISKQLPNPELYEAYIECVEILINPSRTGLVQGRKVENEETVIFNFYYRPTSTSQKAPKVTSFIVEPKNALIDAGGIKKGKRIPSFLMSVICKRSEVNEVTINIQTTDGPINDNSSPTKSSKFETPVGTIIASSLSFDRFREVTGEKGVWKKTDKWAPCDGRDISGSTYSKYSDNATPDLRGYFLRGLNSFDVNPPTGVNRVSVDPDGDGRTVDSPQNDMIRSHSHNIRVDRNGKNSSGNSLMPPSGHNDENWGGEGIIEYTGGKETRPINKAVYYYIKIN